MSTDIEWARNPDGTKGETWNPTTGCDRISPGCDHCYALTMAARLKLMGQAKYQRDGDPRTSGPGFALTVHPNTLDQPLRWKKPRTVFVNSMSDLFHDAVGAAFIGAVFDVMARCPQHTFQVLTKRPQRMARISTTATFGEAWPLPNVWLGTSIESDRYTFRADHLRATPAAVRFLSCEPLLGPLPSLSLDGIDWVIVGGESGPGARPMHPDWVRHIRDRCVAAGVAFFFKQWGEWGELPIGGRIGSGTNHAVANDGRHWPASELAIRFLDEDDGRRPLGDRRFEYVHETGRQLARENPGRLLLHSMYRVGKKHAGRLLDGRTWDEIPGPVR